MPSQVLSSVENNFTKGLVTEFTGLNFPENAATDTDNCVYEIVGDVTRRLGIDKEVNGTNYVLTNSNLALSDFKWDNAGGDGNTQIVVRQVGTRLNFYLSSSATESNPLSQTKLANFINIGSFAIPGTTADSQKECQYASGNGYLFVYHPSCNPFYVTYNAGTLTGSAITLKIRDFTGVNDGLDPSTRPSTLSPQHNYNLVNQGWISGSPWIANSTIAYVPVVGSQPFAVQAGLTGVVNGQIVSGTDTYGRIIAGTVTGYVGTTLTLNVTSVSPPTISSPPGTFTIAPTSSGYLTAWFTAVGNYPSNSDVWWYYKNTSNVFDPATTLSNITLSLGRAPSGHFLLSPFNQTRSGVSGVAGLTDVVTPVRPTHGAWFQGRVWYTGINAQQVTTGDNFNYSWTENIYFSQIVQTSNDFGNCFQTNDPTSENLFDLLPTDGGVITIQGCGSIYKLFPVQNGMLVFAANGIWFITGNQGIGFTANDYTITKISAVRSISGTSFVDVNGLPYFWNEEGIYTVQPSQQGGLEVNPITVGTILSFYNEIPTASKRYVRGAYDYINYIIQWVYRDTDAGSTTENYTFNRMLNYNTYNKSFYPFSIDSSTCAVNGILYVSYPGSPTAPPSSFKYSASIPIGLTYADEHDISYLDWKTSSSGFNYTSYFITGYKLHGQGQRRFQIPYIYMYSRNDVPTSYKIQGQWNYSVSGNSGKWSVLQLVNNFSPNFGVLFRRHRIRGQGLVLQIKLTSTDGMPFDIIGWSTFEQQNMGV